MCWTVFQAKKRIRKTKRVHVIIMYVVHAQWGVVKSASFSQLSGVEQGVDIIPLLFHFNVDNL